MKLPRLFDHDEARRLRAKGWTYQRIADFLGVSPTAVAKACKPDTRKAMDDRSNARHRDARQPCKRGCGRLVWTHVRGRSGYCHSCWGIQLAAEAERPGELLCRLCDTWKPDEEFIRRASGVRRGRRSWCRACETKARRELRQGEAAA